MISLSIIVPVYNVEKYIRPCIESIYHQSLEENCFEVILINDGTTDKSIEIIADIIQQHNNIIVINQANQGVSVARNNGIAVARGEYILMPDSDDLLIENSLSVLLKKALETKADIVIADFLQMSNEEIDQNNFPPQKEFQCRMYTGRELFLTFLAPTRCYAWCNLYRREFLIDNNITFVPGIYLQDQPFTHECYLKANLCVKAEWLLNIYRRHSESATKSVKKYKEKELSESIAIANIWKLTNIIENDTKVKSKLQDSILHFFLVSQRSISHLQNISFDRYAPIDLLREMAPNLDFGKGIKRKTLTLMFRYAPHTLVFGRYIYARVCESTIHPFLYRSFCRMKKILKGTIGH
ncbi:MAG: glycosyltransferase [Muribaculaceae bacterium]|nr:glycosyltransferase [Muribaculaceae bacterium]